MKHVMIPLFLVMMSLIILGWLVTNQRDNYKSSLQRTEDSIRAYKNQNQTLFKRITISEGHEKVLTKKLNQILDSLNRANKQDSILHARLRLSKEKPYTANELHTKWITRYKTIPLATDSTMQITVKLGRKLEFDLERFELSKLIIVMDSVRINYLQELVNVGDSINIEKSKQIDNYKLIVKSDAKIDSTRIVEIKTLNQEVKKQKRLKIVAIAAGSAVLLLSFLIGH